MYPQKLAEEDTKPVDSEVKARVLILVVLGARNSNLRDEVKDHADHWASLSVRGTYCAKAIQGREA